ncbi:MAG: hypothetical protein EPO28_13840 [Saprospiraceae bacterium]|nr:MAG: hypothetical protein EPO28_13840 [Saprospiraceae bacterium]
MKTKRITGKVTWQNLGTGFWGIVDSKGREWRPINMPEQLKKEGKQATITIREVDEGASIFMWGTAVEVTGFGT